METQVKWSYWRHIWTGRCHRAEVGHEWGASLWEQISEDEYEDWVWERRALWTWPKQEASEELGVELL